MLIARLFAALVLCVIGALLHSMALRYVLLTLSVLICGYDYLAAALSCILARQVVRPAVLIIVCVIGTLAVGQPVDAAVFLLVYRLVTILIAVVTQHAQKTLKDAVGGEIHSTAEFPAPKWIDYLAPAGLCIAILVAVLESVLKVATVSQAIHAAMIALFLSTPCALLVSVPLVWYSAVNGAYRCNVLFRSCRSMRALNAVRAVAVDEGEGDNQLPKVVSVKSDQLTPDRCCSWLPMPNPAPAAARRAPSALLIPVRSAASISQMLWTFPKAGWKCILNRRASASVRGRLPSSPVRIAAKLRKAYIVKNQAVSLLAKVPILLGRKIGKRMER